MQEQLTKARDFVNKYLPYALPEEQPAFHVTGGIVPFVFSVLSL